MLRVEHLDVFHGDAQALDDVSIEIGEGTIVARRGSKQRGVDLVAPRRDGHRGQSAEVGLVVVHS